MIFYFSGTGNSQYAAQTLLSEGEQIFNLKDCVKKKQFQFEIPEGEKIGFVFPVYYGGLPSIVQAFLNHAVFLGKSDYVYAVITCGADIYGAGKMLSGRLEERGLLLKAVYPIEMPDNYVVLYSVDDEKTEKQLLQKAELTLHDIRRSVENEEITPVSKGKMVEMLTDLMYPFYAKGRRTKKFWTTDACVSCGACEAKCPSGAIRLIDGKVTWVKEQCAHCMACMSCNAIQYGKATLHRDRYKHPMLRKN